MLWSVYGRYFKAVCPCRKKKNPSTEVAELWFNRGNFVLSASSLFHRWVQTPGWVLKGHLQQELLLVKNQVILAFHLFACGFFLVVGVLFFIFGFVFGFALVLVGWGWVFVFLVFGGFLKFQFFFIIPDLNFGNQYICMNTDFELWPGVPGKWKLER